MRNVKLVVGIQGLVALIAVGALIVSVATTIGQASATRKQVCLYVNGILDAFHTPQGRQSAENIRLHYPALNNCHHH